MSNPRSSARAAKGRVLAEAVDDAAHLARPLPLEDGQRVLRRLARVHDDGLLELARKADETSEDLALHLAGRVVVVVVEPDLAHGHHLGRRRERAELLVRRVAPAGGVVGMNAHAGRDPRGLAPGEGHRGPRLREVLPHADDHEAHDARLRRARAITASAPFGEVARRRGGSGRRRGRAWWLRRKVAWAGAPRVPRLLLVGGHEAGRVRAGRPGAAVLRDPARSRGSHRGRREDRIFITPPREETPGERRLASAARATASDLALAEEAEQRAGGGGLVLLARRCHTVWSVHREAEDDRLALRLAMILASILLGPVLDARGPELFGVKTARAKLG